MARVFLMRKTCWSSDFTGGGLLILTCVWVINLLPCTTAALKVVQHYTKNKFTMSFESCSFHYINLGN